MTVLAENQIAQTGCDLSQHNYFVMFSTKMGYKESHYYDSGYYFSFSSCENRNVINYNSIPTVSKGEKPLNQSYIENLNRLEDIGKLKENWNGNGAPSFTKNQIQMMKQLIYTLKKQPFITPTAKGSIQFEYEDNDYNYLEFELFPNGTIKQFIYSSNGETKTEYIPIEKVSESIEYFYR